ncbi:MAG: phenylacetate--CoA ligase family protein [Candidatus Accumulibacter sp.]|uniref:phenylacetate--CoA ligase family protein n=1 Tax=Accumulibacter sp. TaxID=2053492 RepID=UPI00258B0284|nr:phenylacetate--CoA ligase family protein [Accumulibacter sp.]MCM8620677.1 phenylacetate--CoA ligase family protein [Accumulibacter sp.]
MSFYTLLVAQVFFPLQEALKSHSTLAVRRGMDDSQWWSAEKIEALRLDRLRRLLSSAGSDVPYYRNLFSRIGFCPAKITATSDLARLPLLTKAIIRAEGERMKSQVGRDLARFNTGGSSGEPLIFFIGKERISHDVAAKWRATRWWGVDIGDPEIVVWGSPIELGAQDRLRMLRDKVMRTELLPAFEMSDARLDGFVDRIRVRRPHMLFGYPSAISLIVGHARKRGIALDKLGVKVVFVTSERLYDHQREVISKAFGCPVANGYGGRDAGFIAHECPAGGMHITAEDIIVEIVSTQGEVLPPGSPGEIVVTHLATADFPFVRYRTGDIGTIGIESCTCGRGLPLLREIEGRSTDFLVAADGTVMHGLALIYILRDLPGIDAFRIVQESLESVLVQIVPTVDYEPTLESRIDAGIKARLGQTVAVRIERLLEIPRDKSGKYRYVQSLVAAS